MGFNKLYLPELKTLKEQLMSIGNEEFAKLWVSKYRKADALIGPSESHDFIKQFLKLEYDGTKNNQEVNQ